MPPQSYDIAVVGAGIVGLASAYHVKKDNPDLNIVVIDKAATFAQGNTAKSAAGFRDLFSSDVNFKLSSSSIDFYKHIQKDENYDIGMKFSGYLFLLSKEMLNFPPLETISKKTRTKFFGKDEITQLKYLNKNIDLENAKLMNLKPIEGAYMGYNCGIIEPDLLAKYYYEELVKMNVEFRFGTEVERLSLEPVEKLDYPGEPFIWQNKTIGRLITKKGDIVADKYILATDIWTTDLLDPTGIDSHIRPKKRQVFQISGKEIENMVINSDLSEEHLFPFTIVPSHGIYMRPAPREKSFWVGVADEVGRGFGFVEDPSAERDFYNLNMKQVLESYFTSFRESRITGMWAGYYSNNTIDMNPYIFDQLNMIIATGTSGSGILKGDAVGRIVSALYSGKEEAALYGGKRIKTSALGIEKRNVEIEEFIL